MNNLEIVIHKYQQVASLFVQCMKLRYNTNDLLRAVRQKVIPEEGRVTSSGDIVYNFRFHGAGCRFNDGMGEVDFDFGPDGRCDGFDAWRLAAYCRTHGILLTQQDIETGLFDMAARKLIHKPAWAPGISLWYFLDQ